MKKTKVIIAMSGGVDSSVAAAILKNRGYDVIGIFMLMHKNNDLRDAKIVAKKLGIDFKILDVRKEFKKRVVNYFIQEYKKGNTPNPCVECNRWIKFKFLIDKAMELGADFVATGHYARIQRNLKFKIKNLKLLVASDKTKDQSYFLWQLTQNQLKHVLFPVGDYTKEQVRELARKFNLSVAEKKDSQNICFSAPQIKGRPGDIITTEGKKVGEHKGLIFYTIGQRKGIEVGGTGPYYVVGKNFKKNALIVAQSDFNPALFKKEMKIKSVNWLSKPRQFPFKCKVKIRYLHKSVPATIYNIQNSRLRQGYGGQAKLKICFSAPQRAITPGQSAVFYFKNQLIGGGIIEK